MVLRTRTDNTIYTNNCRIDENGNIVSNGSCSGVDNSSLTSSFDVTTWKETQKKCSYNDDEDDAHFTDDDSNNNSNNNTSNVMEFGRNGRSLSLKDIFLSTTSCIFTQNEGRQTKKQHKKRSVKFAPSYTEIIYDATTAEDDESNSSSSKSDIWYTPKELRLIKRQNASIVKQIRSGEFVEGEHSRRGFEHKLFNCNNCNSVTDMSTKEARVMAVNAVINEQYQQFITGTKDPDAIASAYKDITIQCQEAAHAMGLRDSIL